MSSTETRLNKGVRFFFFFPGSQIFGSLSASNIFCLQMIQSCLDRSVGNLTMSVQHQKDLQKTDSAKSIDKKRTLSQISAVSTNIASSDSTSTTLEKQAMVPPTKKKVNFLQNMPTDLRRIITKPPGSSHEGYLAVSAKDGAIIEIDNNDETNEIIVTWTPETFPRPRQGAVLVNLIAREGFGSAGQFKYLIPSALLTPNLWEILACLHGQTFDESSLSNARVLSRPPTDEEDTHTDRRTSECYWEAWSFSIADSFDTKEEAQKTVMPSLLTILNHPSFATKVPNDCIFDARYIRAYIDIYAPLDIMEACLSDQLDEQDWKEQLQELVLEQPSLLPSSLWPVDE